jgi:opine dehydrogenase
MNISIIGAGNGGQAMSGHFALLGHKVKLYNRSHNRIQSIILNKEINLNDKISGTVKLDTVTDNLQIAIKDSELIMVTVTADAHKEIAAKIAPYIEDGQTIILNPGRTLGAMEFYNEIKCKTSKRIFIGEAQTLIYACRSDTPGNVRIIGLKEKVLLSAFPCADTDFIISKINSVFPCFVKAENILRTSMENIGAMLHPSVIIFNAAAIERGNMFYFYNDMTSAVADFIENIDIERLMIGEAFGIKLLSVSEWVSYAYSSICGNSLLEKIRNNPAYYKILAPNTLYTRLLLEDIPTGIVPMIELGKIAGVETPLMNSILTISQSLVRKNFIASGRTLKNLGLNGINKNDFLKML